MAGWKGWVVELKAHEMDAAIDRETSFGLGGARVGGVRLGLLLRMVGEILRFHLKPELRGRLGREVVVLGVSWARELDWKDWDLRLP